ncbi:transglycosylase SLT domain-containing protein [Serratia fonticola]|uniref:lytic transglycosylase domain-containing protein n=1 Tax=Serratia fonticola TaxID=47917 RepID=UPI001377AD9B|nr:lytic transglycosylase domain-containing protein [Serratia fonticola]NBJ34709.1 transglycosylase SLT domain-containing protein [Serratia fonticola]
MSENIPVITIPVDNEQLKEALSLIEKLSAAAERFNSKYGSPLDTGAGRGWGGVPPGGVGGGNAGGASGDDSGDGAGGGKGFLNNVNKLAKAVEKSFDQVNKTLGKTVGMLKGLFESAISWGLKMALLGTGSTFGYNVIAKNAGQQLMGAQGNRMTTGQIQAAHNVYGNRFGGVDETIQGLVHAQGNISDPAQGGLRMLGIDPLKGAGENLPLLYQKVAELTNGYENSGLAYSQIQSRRLDSLISPEVLNRIMANRDQIPAVNKQYEATSHLLGMPEKVGRSFQSLNTTFDTTTDRMFNSFKTALATLNEPIEKLSKTFSDAVESFLSGPNGKAVFDTLADGVKSFSAWISNPGFQKDLGEFSRAVTEIVKAIGRGIMWIYSWLPGGDQKEGEADAEYQARKQKERSDALARAKSDSSFNNAVSATATTLAVPAREGSGNGGFWGGVKALGQTVGGIVGTVGKNMFPDLDERWRAGGWQNYQSTQEPVQHAQAARSSRGGDGLPSNLLNVVEQVESGGNRFAVSKAGAMGPFQFMPGTAKDMGLRGGEVFDRDKAEAAARRYFQMLFKRYDGDAAKAVAAYNWGMGNVDKHGLTSLPKETYDYLRKILPQIGEADSLSRIAMRETQQTQVATQSRMVIDVALNQAPGSDINAQLRSNMPPPIIIPF